MSTLTKPTEKWHLLLTAAALSVTVGLIVVKQAERISVLQQQVYNLNEAKLNTSDQLKEVNGQLKEMNGTLTKVLVELQNKQDRK